MSVDHLGREWLFNNHGHRTLVWDDHCNRGYTRWILREHGITLAGPEARSFMDQVPGELLRSESRAAVPTLIADLATWLDIDALAWGQRYAVVTASRILYTLATAEVASKPGALEWAQRTLDPTVATAAGSGPRRADRGWEPDRPPRPGEADAARAFAAYAVEWASAMPGRTTSLRP